MHTPAGVRQFGEAAEPSSFSAIHAHWAVNSRPFCSDATDMTMV